MPWLRSIADLRAQALRLHQTKHAMATARFATLAQVGGEFAMAINATAGDPVMLDQTDQPAVLARSWSMRRLMPCVVTAPMHAKNPAHGDQPEFMEMIANERVLGLYPLAKYAAAFLGCHAPQ